MTRTVGAVTAETVTISGTIDGNGFLSGNATSSVRGASPMTGTVGPDGTIVMNFTWGAVNYRGNGQVIRDTVDRTHVSGSATVGEVGAANPPQYAIDWTYSP